MWTPNKDQIISSSKIEEEVRLEYIAAVKQEASRRIENVMPMWMIAREISGGGAISEDIKDIVKSIRDKSNELEINVIPLSKMRLDSTWN